MLERIEELRDEAAAAVAAAVSAADLEEARVRWLGRKSELTSILRGIAELPAEQRGPVGKAANEARKAVEAAVEEKAAALEGAETDARLAADVVDVTLPGSPAQPVGRLHLLTATRREIEDWIDMTPQMRREVMAGLPARLATVERRPRRETKRARMARQRGGTI